MCFESKCKEGFLCTHVTSGLHWRVRNKRTLTYAHGPTQKGLIIILIFLISILNKYLNIINYLYKFLYHCFFFFIYNGKFFYLSYTCLKILYDKRFLVLYHKHVQNTLSFYNPKVGFFWIKLLR